MKTSIFLLGAALFLAACDNNSTADGPRAGGEDFPNAIQSLGRTLAQGMDSTKSWNGLDSASTDAGTGGSALPDTVAAFAARSFALCQDDSTFTALSANKAVWEKTTCLPGTLVGYVHDSIVYAIPAKGQGMDTVYWWANDSVRLGYRSGTWLEPYARDYFRLKGDTGKVWYNVSRKAERWSDFTRTLVDGGRDGNLGTDKDNTYWSSTRSLVKDAATSPDTVWAIWTQPAVAGESVIGSLDSGFARVTRLDRHALRRKVESGLFMVHRDEARNYARLWSARTDWNSGLTRWQAVYGSRPDSSFRARDTVRFLDRFRHADKPDSTRIDAVAILGPSLLTHDKDSVLSLRYERYRSSLWERHTIWEIRSDNPVPNGGESRSGSVFARIEFSNGKYGQFQGKWNAQFFAGTWSNGLDSFTVVVRRDGSVQSATKL